MLVLEAASTISTPYIYLLSRFRSIFFSQLLLLMQILIPSLHKYPFTVSPFSPPFSSQLPLCIAIVEQTKRKKNERKKEKVIMMAGGRRAQYYPRTVKEVFQDFKGRRAAMLKALTTGLSLSLNWHFFYISNFLIN